MIRGAHGHWSGSAIVLTGIITTNMASTTALIVTDGMTMTDLLGEA
jgi:hypothetical protein